MGFVVGDFTEANMAPMKQGILPCIVYGAPGIGERPWAT